MALKKQEAVFSSKGCLYWIIVLDWWSLALALALAFPEPICARPSPR